MFKDGEVILKQIRVKGGINNAIGSEPVSLFCKDHHLNIRLSPDNTIYVFSVDIPTDLMSGLKILIAFQHIRYMMYGISKSKIVFK